MLDGMHCMNEGGGAPAGVIHASRTSRVWNLGIAPNTRRCIIHIPKCGKQGWECGK